MPRNVRNFWIDANIDGRKERLTGGPRRKDGGFALEVSVRSEGDSQRALCIVGRQTNDGELQICIWDGDGAIWNKRFRR